MANEQDRWKPGTQYEVAFCVFLVVLAYLWRDNPHLAYPQILYLFLALLGMNLAAGWTFRRWPAQEWASAAVIMANCAVITAILAYSGGTRSNLWVLYLLPVYTACTLLGNRYAAWVTFGAAAFNALFSYCQEPVFSDAALFVIALKSGIFAFTAATTCAVVRRDRSSSERVRQQRERLSGLEDEMEERAAELGRSQRLAEVGMLSSGVAHDLKNPLTVILATVDMMIQDDPNGHAEDIRRIQRSAELCRSIIGTVLGMSKDRGFDPKPSDIHEIIEGAASLYEHALREHGIRIERDYGRSLPEAALSAYEMQRVFLNLLSNAKDAMPEGGTVTIRTRMLEHRNPAAPRILHVIVEDTGSGIPKEAMEKLFTSFASTKGPHKGTGLGLYLCRGIVMKHRGSLWAENKPKGGARFTISIPVCEDLSKCGAKLACTA